VNETLIFRSENGGYAKAKNDCIRHFLDGDWEYLILLDDDVEILSDLFCVRYVSRLDRVPILSFNDAEFTKTEPRINNGLAETDHTCGVCVVMSRQTATRHPRLPVYAGKWGLHHTYYYSEVLGQDGRYFDIEASDKVIRIASHASVYTEAEKLESLQLTRSQLESMK
jgi:glycosyltransferase involved in cell wall biosynthesis